MSNALGPSLLDNAQFLEELAKLEALPAEDTSAFPQPSPTLAPGAQPSAVAAASALSAARVPQFVLAPPPRRRRSGSRESLHTAVHVRTPATNDGRSTASETVSTTEHVSASAARSDEPRASAVEAPPVGIEAETSLSAFPAESPQPAASPRIKREPVRSPARSSVHPVVAAVGFVLMMSIGAGAAALVFHDRVTLIVAQWHIASR